jgi:hypothetical protein
MCRCGLKSASAECLYKILDTTLRFSGNDFVFLFKQKSTDAQQISNRSKFPARKETLA